MLLRIEVAAFHPATPCSACKTCNTELAVPVHAEACPRRRLVSVALFLSRAQPRVACGRAAVSRYPALWSPDLPRYQRYRDCPACLAVPLYIGRRPEVGCMRNCLALAESQHAGSPRSSSSKTGKFGCLLSGLNPERRALISRGCQQLRQWGLQRYALCFPFFKLWPPILLP